MISEHHRTTLNPPRSRPASSRHTRLPIPVFAPLMSNAFDRPDALPTQLEIPKGTVLLEQGLVADTVSLLQKGLVKLLIANENGRHAMLGLRSAGWYAGAAAAVLQSACSYSVVALTACSITPSPSAVFFERLNTDAGFARHFLDALAAETISVAQLRAQLTTHSAEDRLRTYMKERAATPEWEAMDPLVRLKQVDLAHLLSLTPEHLNRMLRKLKLTQLDLNQVSYP